MTSSEELDMGMDAKAKAISDLELISKKIKKRFLKLESLKGLDDTTDFDITNQLVILAEEYTNIKKSIIEIAAIKFN